MGPQRKHYDFFKAKTLSTPSRLPSTTANLSDSSVHEHSPMDSDSLLGNSIDIDIATPRSSDQPESTSLRQRKAWAWNHGSLNETHLQCNYCPKSYDASAMTHPNNHLTTKHNIKEAHQRGKPLFPSQISEHSRTFFIKKVPFILEVFQSNLIDWILRDRISFHEIESEAFRDMIRSIRPEAVEALSCANTIRAHCMRRFKEVQDHIKSRFAIA